MLKLRAGDLVIFGLDAENIRRLQDGSPIRIKGADLGLGDVTIYISYGATLAHIATDLGLPQEVVDEAKKYSLP